MTVPNYIGASPYPVMGSYTPYGGVNLLNWNSMNGAATPGASSGAAWPGILGGFVGNNINHNAYDASVNSANNALWNPTTINTPLSSVSYNGNAYNVNSPYAGLLSKLGGLAGSDISRLTGLNGATGTAALAKLDPAAYGAYTGASSALGAGSSALTGQGNRFLTAADGFLPGSFDPSKISADMYAKLSALAAPGDTSATQAMFNRLQANGRLGLNQNGELGDLGGLALAQQQANNQRALQAMTYGNDLVAQRAGLASGLAGTGQGLLTSGMDASTQRFNLAANAMGLGNSAADNLYGHIGSALGDMTGLNTALMAPLNASLTASAERSNANANVANLIGAASRNYGSNQSNLLGGTLAGLEANGGLPSLGQIGGGLNTIGDILTGSGHDTLGGIASGVGGFLQHPGSTIGGWLSGGAAPAISGAAPGVAAGGLLEGVGLSNNIGDMMYGVGSQDFGLGGSALASEGGAAGDGLISGAAGGMPTGMGGGGSAAAAAHAAAGGDAAAGTGASMSPLAGVGLGLGAMAAWYGASRALAGTGKMSDADWVKTLTGSYAKNKDSFDAAMKSGNRTEAMKWAQAASNNAINAAVHYKAMGDTANMNKYIDIYKSLTGPGSWYVRQLAGPNTYQYGSLTGGQGQSGGALRKLV